MKEERCSFCVLKLECVCYSLNEMGYKLLTKCIKAILKMEPPKNVNQINAFNGTLNFIKNHIPRQAKILEPITRLMKKEMKFE